MGRILVLMLLAGLAGIFFIIYNAGKPVQSAAPSNSNTTAEGNTRRTKQSQLEKSRAQSTRTARTRRRKDPSEPSMGTTDGGSVTASGQKTARAAGDPLLTVSGDSTPVYTTNSKRSKVIRVLSNGDKVRPDMEVLDSNGRWRVVRGQQKDKPGFVLEDQIERAPADSSKNKNGPGQTKEF